MTLSEARDIVANMSYRDWKFLVIQEGEHLFLRVSFSAKDSKTGELVPWNGRKWRLSKYMTRSEVVQTAFLAVRIAEEHELREHFLYFGRPIFGPHHNVDDLVEAIERRQVRQDTRI